MHDKLDCHASNNLPIIESSSSLIGRRKVNQDDMDIQGFGENVAELLTYGSPLFLFLDQCAAEN